MKQVNPWWVTGISDGESCFVIQSYRKKATHTMTWRFFWSLHLRTDDRATLRKLQRYFGGTVTTSGSRKLALQVFRHEDLVYLIDHFRTYPLQSKKQKDFRLWARAFEAWTKKRGWRSMAVHATMRAVKEELSRIRKFNPGEEV